MSKKQFVLLVIFVILFLVPEILWSPLSNMILSFITTTEIFRNSSFIHWSIDVKTIVLFLQSIGLISLLIYLINILKLIKSQFSKTIVFVGVLVVGCLVFVGLFLTLMSILLRNIGF